MIEVSWVDRGNVTKDPDKPRQGTCFPSSRTFFLAITIQKERKKIQDKKDKLKTMKDNIKDKFDDAGQSFEKGSDVYLGNN